MGILDENKNIDLTDKNSENFFPEFTNEGDMYISSLEKLRKETADDINKLV